MRVPAVDRPLDEREWRSFLERQGFGHLVAPGAGRDLPVVAPLPFVLDGDQVLAHAPAGHEVLGALEERPRALLCVAGATAFVPSAWKAIDAEDPRLGIPTTYFAAVQLAGTTELVTDEAALAGVLHRQLAAFQPGIDVADPLEAHAGRLRSICGIVLHVEEVAARFKFGGNVDEPHRRAVLRALEDRGASGDAAAIEHLRRRVRGAGRGAFTR